MSVVVSKIFNKNNILFYSTKQSTPMNSGNTIETYNVLLNISESLGGM